MGIGSNIDWKKCTWNGRGSWSCSWKRKVGTSRGLRLTSYSWWWSILSVKGEHKFSWPRKAQSLVELWDSAKGKHKFSWTLMCCARQSSWGTLSFKHGWHEIWSKSIGNVAKVGSQRLMKLARTQCRIQTCSIIMMGNEYMMNICEVDVNFWIVVFCCIIS